MQPIMYKDDFKNTAFITEEEIYPYYGASKRVKAYKLELSSDYDDDFTYHVSVHETLAEAEKKLSKMSCGTFKKM